MNFKKNSTKITIIATALIFTIFQSPLFSKINEITTVEQFKTVVDTSKKLLVFDLYADWCQPCKMLSPTLDKISEEQEANADFYKVNVDKNKEIAAALGVSGIPFVVFIKNKTGVTALTGLNPKDSYVKIIQKYSKKSTEDMYKNLTPKEFKNMITEKALLLDVRTNNEYKEGHLKGAKLIPVQVLSEKYKDILNFKTNTVLIYCRSGNRSRSASQFLVLQGFTKVYNLNTGIKGWEKAGFEIIK